MITVNNAFLYPINIRTRMSPRMLALIYAAHAVSLIVVPGLPLSWAVRSVLILCVGFSLWHVDTRHRRRNDPGYPAEIQLNRYDEWRLILPDGEYHTAELLPASFVHPWLVVLRFRMKGKRVAVILTPDVAGADRLRRLRVRLKYRKSPAAQDASINA